METESRANRPGRIAVLAALVLGCGFALEAPLDALQRGGQQRRGRGLPQPPGTGANRPREAPTPAAGRATPSIPMISPFPAPDAAADGAPTGARGTGLSPTGVPLAGATTDEVYPFGYPAEQRQRLYFTSADANQSGWISYREAAESLRFDAARYRVFDVDNDGRMTFEEFSAFVLDEAAAGRIVPEPIQVASVAAQPARSPEQLRSAYDVDLDGALSELELERLLADYQRDAVGRLDARTLLERLDANGTERLEISELGRVADFLAPLAKSGPEPLPGARSVLEMFGTPIFRGEASVPQIVGPVPPFHRLDVDGDGFVELSDLEVLEGSTFAPVRLKSVLNTLDLDNDGRMSEAEFLSAMTPKRRGSGAR